MKLISIIKSVTSSNPTSFPLCPCVVIFVLVFMYVFVLLCFCICRWSTVWSLQSDTDRRKTRTKKTARKESRRSSVCTSTHFGLKTSSYAKRNTFNLKNTEPYQQAFNLLLARFVNFCACVRPPTHARLPVFSLFYLILHILAFAIWAYHYRTVLVVCMWAHLCVSFLSI